MTRDYKKLYDGIVAAYRDPAHPHFSRNDDPTIVVQREAVEVMAAFAVHGLKEIEKAANIGGTEDELNDAAIAVSDGLSFAVAGMIANWARQSADPVETAQIMVTSIAEACAQALTGDIESSVVNIPRKPDA